MDNQDDKVRLAVEAALAKHFDKVKETMTDFQKQYDEKGGRVSDGIKEEIAKLNKDGQKLMEEEIKLRRAADQRILDLEQKIATQLAAGAGSRVKPKSVGEVFVESPQFKDFATKQSESSGRFMMEPVKFKDITGLTSSGGPGIFPEYLPTPVIPAFQPLTIRDLLGQATTGSNSIIWVQENVFTDNSGYQGSEGSLKAQSDLTYVQKTIVVVTLGHWMKASKQVLADFAVLRSLIDNRLNFGLKLVEEREILFGDGATNHLHGLVPQATAYNTAYTKGGDTMVDLIRHAILQTTMAFYPATGVALSPTDWHNIELLKDGFHRYLFANPQGIAPAMIWGLPVAQCYSMGIGDFLVGSMKLAVTLFDREQAQILVSTEDQDNFVRNMVTILCEERLALAVSRPQALIWGAFPSGSTSD